MFIMFRVVLLASLVIRDIWRVLFMYCESLVVMFGKICCPALDLRLYLKVEWPPKRKVPPMADMVLFISEPKVRFASRMLSL